MRRPIIAGLFAIALPIAALAQKPAAIPDIPTPFLMEQQANEWRMNNYIGKTVYNDEGQKIGEINDVLFDKNGKVTAVVLSVGGVLGMGAKYVALPYQAVTYAEKDGERQIVVPLTKKELLSAPDYKLTEKTTLDKVREKAGEAAEKASEKASELKDQAVKKIEEYNK